MGNTSTTSRAASARCRGAEAQEKGSQFQVDVNFTTDLDHSFVSAKNNQSFSAFGRSWSRASRKRCKRSVSTHDLSKTVWPVSQVESFFLPEFPVTSVFKGKNFVVLEEIASGSFGKVFRIQDDRSDEIFALKVLFKSQIIRENSVEQRFDRMNARSEIFELTMEGRQVDEAVASIFHTILFHRSLGKFFYNAEGSYSVGTIGYTDVDCDFIDLTYVCCTSNILDRNLKREISCFSELLRGNEGTGMGQISLEFFQKKRKGWIWQPDCIPWEVWTIRLELITLNNEDERQVCREKVGEILTDKILYITEVMNRHDYLPKVPNQSDLELIFDTSYIDIQPYLFKIQYSLSGPSASSSVGSTMKKLIKETLSL